MRHRPEPSFAHGVIRDRTGVLLVNLGTPDAATAPAVGRYLREFLSDPRVIEIPGILWKPLLHGLIAPLRSKPSAHKYATVWLPEGSPLLVWSQKQAVLLRGLLGSQGHDLPVELGMRYGNPSIASALDRLKEAGATRIVVMPLYPQYAASTTASAWDAISTWASEVRNVPALRMIKHYHDHPQYIDALAKHLQTQWQREGRLPPSGDEVLLMSFHGLPKRTLMRGDPYHCECLKTARLLTERLGLSPDHARVSFQSRFGRAEWLSPYTAATLERLGRDRRSRVEVFCPGFPADCLETLEEIAIEGRATFLKSGGKQFHFIPCMNDSAHWISAMADIVLENLQGWPTGARAPDTEREQQRARALAMGASA